MISISSLLCFVALRTVYDALSPLIRARPEQPGLRLAIFVHDQREAYCTADREWTEYQVRKESV